jgi:CubicO group peptidase (beta-lactamase class C family)
VKVGYRQASYNEKTPQSLPLWGFFTSADFSAAAHSGLSRQWGIVSSYLRYFSLKIRAKAVKLLKFQFGEKMNFQKYLLLVLMPALMSACGGGAGDAPPPPPPTIAESIDASIKIFMQDTGATTVMFSAIEGGRPLYESVNRAGDSGQAALPTPVSRTASIIKPVTAAAIQQLAAKGKLALSDRVFCTGNNAPCWLAADLLPAGADARAKDITIAHLIAHEGGWDRAVSGDPAAMEPAIRDSLGLQRPPLRAEIIRYVMAKPLDAAPGAKAAYSNFGYLLLGDIIAQASGTSYFAYVYNNVMAPLGIGDWEFKQARSRLAERDPREPVYRSTLMAPSIYTVGATALAMNEGVELENWTASGGVLASAHAMAMFAYHFRIPDGLPLGVGGATIAATKDGNMPGTTTIMRQLGGHSYAVLVNAEITAVHMKKLTDRLDQIVVMQGI